MQLKDYFGTRSLSMLAVFVCFVMIAGALFVISTPVSEGATLDRFKTTDSYNLTFNTNGINAEPVFNIENQVPIIDAQMKISTADKGDGDYPLCPIVDVGVDSDTEWAYNGDGYGFFGKQNKYTDNTTSATSEFGASGGSKTTANFYMPKGATATSASMDVRGRFVPTAISEYDVAQTGLRYPYESHTGNIDNVNNDDIAMISYDYNNGQVYWFKCPNPATGTWTKGTVENNVPAPWDVRIGDIEDTNGGSDVVLGTYSYTGSVYWYHNVNDNGNNWQRYTIASNLNYPGYVRIADMDNDGDNDVVVGCYGYYTYYSASNPMVRWYENNGNPTASPWTSHYIYHPTTYNDCYIRAIDVGNFDSNSYPDVVWSTYYNIRWAKNPGASGSWATYLVNSGTTWYYCRGIVAVNLDGDTDDDIATCSGYSSTYGVAWWKNPGTTGAWTKYNVDTSLRYGNDIVAMDFDGSNALDIGVVAYSYSSGYDYTNVYTSTSTNPTGSWNKRSVTSNTFKSPYTIASSNFDGVNRADVVIASYYTGSVSWYSNNGLATSWSANKIIEGGIQDPWGMDKGDLDGDNDLDIVVCGYTSDEICWYENDGSPASGTWTRHTIDGNADAAMNCEIVDIDGDLDNDVVATLYRDYQVVLYINNGAASFTKKVIASSLTYVRSLSTGDIDRDGHIDVLAATYYSSYGGLMWFEAPNTPTGTWIKHTIDTGANYVYDIEAGDIDQDNDLDAVVIKYSYSGGTVEWYECPLNPKTATAWASTTIQSGIKYGSSVELGDIDRDGDLDVAYTEQYYDVWWNRNPTNPKTTPWAQYNIATFTSSYPWGLALDDIGQDGYWDVAFTTYYTDQVYWAEQDDNPIKPWKVHTVDTLLDYAWGVCIGDFDDDGIEDIAATGYGREEVCWYKIQTQYCTSPEIDIGADSSPEWSSPGECKGVYHFEFKDPMNGLLASAGTGTVDAYGNEMVTYPVKLTVGAAAGKITIFNISIEYEYTAIVDINPHNTNLATEVQEILDNDRSGSERIDIHVSVGTAGPGKVRLHDLVINYNAHPDLDQDISTITIKEDSDNANVLDLADHFSDDFDAASDLTYTIQMSYHDSNYVILSIQNTMLSAKTVVPNWHGEVSAMITATDNGDGLSAASTSTVSNEFKVVVEPVNDEPVIGDAALTNIRLNEGSSVTWLCLDDEEYFTDIENDPLFYKAVVDPEETFTGEDITVNVDGDHYIHITANGDFTGESIPVRIYCDDDSTFGELNEINPYHDFKVSVDNLPDDPPFWDPIEPVYIPEDSELMEVVDLMDYVHDPDTPLSQLDIYLTGNTNSSWLPASIDDAGMLSVASAQADYDGSTMVTIKAWDGYNYGLTTVWIYVIPENDLPTVKITNPLGGEEIYKGDLFTVIGSAKDPEDLQKVEIGFGKSGAAVETWHEVQGLTSWIYDWNTDDYSDGDQVTIYARSFDGIEYSEYDFVKVNIKEDDLHTKDTDRDGVTDDKDKFPENPYEWEDKDGDGHGDNQDDRFPDDPNEWEDSDLDGIGDKKDDTPHGVKPEDDGGGSGYKEEEGDGMGINLWWLVLILVIIEVLFIIFLMVKKFRSRRPVPKKKVIQKKKAEP